MDVNCHDAWDTTPLYHAAFTGNLQMVNYLLDNGAKCAEKVCLSFDRPLRPQGFSMVYL